MKKSEIIEKISYIMSVDKKSAKEAMFAITHTISKHLLRGNRIELRGFGVFGVKKMPKRLSKNPKTGEKINLDARNKAYFKSSKKLKEEINR